MKMGKSKTPAPQAGKSRVREYEGRQRIAHDLLTWFGPLLSCKDRAIAKFLITLGSRIPPTTLDFHQRELRFHNWREWPAFRSRLPPIPVAGADSGSRFF